MFEGLRQINSEAISDFRGFIDPSNLKQFNQFEGGYSIFTVVSIPYFLQKLATSEALDPKDGKSFKSKYGDLIKTYVRMLENEFRGISGLDDITGETGEFTNGITTIQMINKITQQSNIDFSMTYTEKAGAPITRTHELFLTGIKDPRTQFKRYHGLIGADDGIDFKDVGFQSECFSFLYIVTDNTGLRVEKSFYIVGAQPKTAQISELYNTTKGEYDFKEISTEFTGNVITGKEIDAKAVAYLERLTGYNGQGVAAKKTGEAVFDAVTTDFSKYEALTNARGSNPTTKPVLGPRDENLHDSMKNWRQDFFPEDYT